MITLRPDQREYIDKLRLTMSKHKSILIQASCGYGKTLLAAYIARSASLKNNIVYFTVHRNQLIRQTQNTFNKFDIEHGIIASSYTLNYKYYANVQICSINTLKNRLHKYKIPKIVIIDECHFAVAAGWSKVIEFYRSKGCWIIGLTASPWRMSGEGLEKHFEVMIKSKPIKWLIDNKHLSTYKIFSPPAKDISKVHVRMGDFVQSELEQEVDKKEIIGDMVTHWIKYANGKRTLGFAVSVKHSQHLAEIFNKNGIPAVHLDAETSQQDRNNYINQFADGEILIIFSCNLMCEGFDLTAQIGRDCPVEAIILGRPTMSVALHTQQIGRGLRYKPDPAVILDHANNVKRHGLPDDEIEWTLEGKQKRKKNDVEESINIKTCPDCFYVCHSHILTCPECGHIFGVQSRDIEHKDGELIEINPEEIRKQRLKEQGMAKSLEDLIELGKRKNYKPGWAYKIHGIRRNKKKVDQW